MQEISIKKAIETAIRAEELGIGYYSELAKQYSKQPEIKKMFELLAKDEVDHKRQFTEMMKDVQDKQVVISDLDEAFFRSVDISRFFSDMESVDTSIDPLDVLRRALQFEKESVLFYQQIRDLIGPDDTMDRIIAVEKKHVSQIMKYMLTDSRFRGVEDKWI